MRYRYSTKQGVFETNDYKEIPFNELHSLNDEPSYENLLNGDKVWCFEGKWHRESGPARIYSNGNSEFWLNDTDYENVNSWLENHTNQDITFQAMMRLQYA